MHSFHAMVEIQRHHNYLIKIGIQLSELCDIWKQEKETLQHLFLLKFCKIILINDTCM